MERAVEKLEVGMLVRDNDPRQAGRVGRITQFFQPDRATLVRAEIRLENGRHTSVLLCRIHTDGKQRKSGWSVVG